MVLMVVAGRLHRYSVHRPICHQNQPTSSYCNLLWSRTKPSPAAATVHLYEQPVLVSEERILQYLKTLPGYTLPGTTVACPVHTSSISQDLMILITA